MCSHDWMAIRIRWFPDLASLLCAASCGLKLKSGSSAPWVGQALMLSPDRRSFLKLLRGMGKVLHNLIRFLKAGHQTEGFAPMGQQPSSALPHRGKTFVAKQNHWEFLLQRSNIFLTILMWLIMEWGFAPLEQVLWFFWMATKVLPRWGSSHLYRFS